MLEKSPFPVIRLAVEETGGSCPLSTQVELEGKYCKMDE